jgi:AhpD family alkylhydroperoxidase
MFALIAPDTAPDDARDLLATTQQQLGRVPNLYAAMANSPTALGGYLAFRGGLQKGSLDVKMRERVALRVAQLNDCDYCVAAHTFRGGKIGLTSQDLIDTRLGRHEDGKTDAALRFVTALVGRDNAQIDAGTKAVLEAGWTEAQVGEIVAHVALNVFSNLFKQVAHPPLDFPSAPDLPR